MNTGIVDDYSQLLKEALDRVPRGELLGAAFLIRDGGDRHAAIDVCSNSGAAASRAKGAA